MKTIKMGIGGRLKIPLEAWEQIGVKPGDLVELTVTEAGVLEFRKYQGDHKEKINSVTGDDPQDFDQVRNDINSERGKLRGKSTDL